MNIFKTFSFVHTYFNKGAHHYILHITIKYSASTFLAVFKLGNKYLSNGNLVVKF